MKITARTGIALLFALTMVFGDPEKQLCTECMALKKCGGREYNPNFKFCHKGRIHYLCYKYGYNMTDGVSYNPETHKCHCNRIGYCQVEEKSKEDIQKEVHKDLNSERARAALKSYVENKLGSSIK